MSQRTGIVGALITDRPEPCGANNFYFLDGGDHCLNSTKRNSKPLRKRLRFFLKTKAIHNGYMIFYLAIDLVVWHLYKTYFGNSLQRVETESFRIHNWFTANQAFFVAIPLHAEISKAIRIYGDNFQCLIKNANRARLLRSGWSPSVRLQSADRSLCEKRSVKR